MLSIKKYVKVDTINEAYELNQKKSNKIIGGMLWLKMSRLNINTAIDLSGLGLDKISEIETEFKIGCMVTLRDLEINESLNKYTNNSFKECVKNIVGIQFRNSATVGGSIYGRYGFSDILTMFMALDTYVELYKGGLVSIKDFATMKPDNDIIMNIIIKKQNLKCVYFSERISKTDFPIITVCISMNNDKFNISVGAKPSRASVIQCDINNAYNVCDNFIFNSNMRGSCEYRKHIANVLIKRGLNSLRSE